MGHIRLGVLPKSRKWQQVVYAADSAVSRGMNEMEGALANREFLFEYRFSGAEWGITVHVHAADPAEAREKIKAVALAFPGMRCWPVAVVEAKRESIDPLNAKEQARAYAQPSPRPPSPDHQWLRARATGGCCPPPPTKRPTRRETMDLLDARIKAVAIKLAAQDRHNEASRWEIAAGLSIPMYLAYWSRATQLVAERDAVGK